MAKIINFHFCFVYALKPQSLPPSPAILTITNVVVKLISLFRQSLACDVYREQSGMTNHTLPRTYLTYQRIHYSVKLLVVVNGTINSRFC